MNGSSRADPQSVLDHVTSLRPLFIDLLHRMTLLESPSDKPELQHAIRDLVAGELRDLGFRVRKVPGNHSGGMLFARPAGRIRDRPCQLILGHYDTVWPEGTLENMPFKVNEDLVCGPGVYDMRGGIAMAILALRTLSDLGLRPEVTPIVFLNSDEEIGSHESTRYVVRLARVVNRVLVLEPSLGQAGHLKTTRKGVGRFTVTVAGEAAHAGLDPDAGASAILELSHVIQSLFALNDFERGVSVNVGTIDGGLRPNVVAPASQAVIDVRVPTERDARDVANAIHGLRPTIPGTRLRVEGAFGRPAMEATPANRSLSQLALRLGRQLGLELSGGNAGGGSDGNTTSLFTATLDGLGAVGDGAHAPHEHLHVGRSLERTALLVLLLLAAPVNVNTIAEHAYA